MRILIDGTDNNQVDFAVTMIPVWNDYCSVTIAGGNDIHIETDTYFNPQDPPVTFSTHAQIFSYIPSYKEQNGILYFYDFFDVDIKNIYQGHDQIVKYYRSRNMTERAERVKHSFLYIMNYTLPHKMGKVSEKNYYEAICRIGDIKLN